MIPLKRRPAYYCPAQPLPRIISRFRTLAAPLILLFTFITSSISADAQENSSAETTGFKTPSPTKFKDDKGISIRVNEAATEITLQGSSQIAAKTIGKITSTETFVINRTQKLIRRAQEAELRVLQQLSRASKLSSDEVLRINVVYDRMLSGLQTPAINVGFAREYLPKMDSLLTSASFLRSLTGGTEIDQLTEKLSTLQSSYFQAANIQKEIAGRVQDLIQKYKDQIPLKELQRIKRISQTAKAQIQEFKKLIENPVPKVERLIDMAVQQKGFEGYFAEHAELSRLFKRPNLSLGESKPDPGLQTVAQLEKQIQEKFGSSGKSLLGKQQQFGQNAMSGVQSDLRNSLLGLGGKSQNEPNINTESVKPAKKRFSLSTDIRSQRTNGWLPAFSEIGINLGYRLSPRFISGIGVSGRVGWGRGFSDFKVSMEGVGIRSFVDYKIKGGFFATGGFEAVYDPLPDLQSRIATFSQWQKNGLIGIKKGFRIKNGFIKGASIKLMWNYLSYTQKGIVQPFDFRVGYDF